MRSSLVIWSMLRPVTGIMFDRLHVRQLIREAIDEVFKAWREPPPALKGKGHSTPC